MDWLNGLAVPPELTQGLHIPGPSAAPPPRGPTAGRDIPQFVVGPLRHHSPEGLLTETFRNLLGQGQNLANPLDSTSRQVD